MQFYEMCARHAESARDRPTRESILPFLQRCIEVGLLRREGDLYLPTHTLARCFPD